VAHFHGWSPDSVKSCFAHLKVTYQEIQEFESFTGGGGNVDIDAADGIMSQEQFGKCLDSV